jgi:hypothetical protein
MFDEMSLVRIWWLPYVLAFSLQTIDKLIYSFAQILPFSPRFVPKLGDPSHQKRAIRPLIEQR